jgi:hypothetical protein
VADLWDGEVGFNGAGALHRSRRFPGQGEGGLDGFGCGQLSQLACHHSSLARYG